MTTRRRIANADLLAKYLHRKARALDKLDRAILKTFRANSHLSRVRAENQYVTRKLEELTAAIERGEEYPKERVKKKKKGRAIELD